MRRDPRSPLIIDTQELPRRPGAMLEVTRTIPAPQQWGTDVIAIHEGTGMHLELRLESASEGILLSGTLDSLAAGECVRCLAQVELPVRADMQELYLYPGREVSVADADDELRQLEAGDLIDLTDVLRDTAVSALPFQPLCRPDCPGLCSTCGTRLADEPGHHHETTDPRWSALAGLLEEASGAKGGGEDSEKGEAK